VESGEKYVGGKGYVRGLRFEVGGKNVVVQNSLSSNL
jgi:hypothetical protein